MRHLKILVAELIGTMILVIGGPGSAVLAGKGIGTLGIALAFGLSLLVAAYAIGPVSGCHINPAVTIGLWLMRKTEGAKVPAYLVGQVLGGALGGLVVFAIAHDLDGFDAKNNFAANGWGDFSPGGYGLASTVIVEILLTAFLVFVVLSTSHRSFPTPQCGIVIGLTLTLIHLVSIPVDNTSVNPARSIATALFAGTDALKQLWAFVLFPIVGACVGVLAWVAVDDAKLDDTMFAEILDEVDEIL